MVLEKVSTFTMHLQTERWRRRADENFNSGVSVHVADVPPEEYRIWAGIAHLEGCSFTFTHEGHMLCHFQNGRRGFEFAIRTQTQPEQLYVVSVEEESREEYNARIQILKSSISPDQEPWMQHSKNGFEYRQ